MDQYFSRHKDLSGIMLEDDIFMSDFNITYIKIIQNQELFNDKIKKNLT